MLPKLLKFILVLIAIFFIFRFAQNKGWLFNQVFSKLTSYLPTEINLPWNKDKKLSLEGIDVSQVDLEKLGTDGVKQAKDLAAKAKEAGSTVQEFSQEVIQVNENDNKTVSEKAFEYGRYIYCQEVVKQYEASHSSVTSF